MKTNVLKSGLAKTALACGILAGSLPLGATAFAFSDLNGDPAEAQINALYEAGVINGVSNQLFAPKSKVTYGQAIHLLVKGLELKAIPDSDGPAKASDYFTGIGDTSWAAPSFLIAVQNGLQLDKTTKPSASITRAAFVRLLDQALQAKGDFPATKMYVNVTDGGNLDAATMASIQTLVNMRVIQLDSGGYFRPDDALTRSEAAVWIYNARAVVQNAQNGSAADDNADVNPNAAVTIEKAGEGVNKATVIVDNLPNPGYGLSIARIEFGADQKAVIYYEITKPAAGKMYPQVISKASAVTYLPDGYTATAQPLPGSYTPPASGASPLY